MPSGAAAAATAAASAEPSEPPPPRPLLLLQQRLSGLVLRDRGGGVGGIRRQKRRREGLGPLGEPGPGGVEEEDEEEEEEEEEEEAAAVGDEGDLELEEEELLAGEDEEEEEEEDAAALLLLSSSSSPSRPLPLLPALGSVLLSPSFDGREAAAAAVAGEGAALCGADDDPRGMMAAMLSHPYGTAGGPPGLNGEQTALLRRKSVNTTECVPVPSSEHVAEIVGRQGCKIKALRAKTNTYIKTPVRGEEPIFVVTGRKEDVAMAKREILSAAEHFSMIRASRNKNAPTLGSFSCNPNLPGQTTVQVRVPYRVVGLVVGPKGATIKRIQQQTHTYIVTPSRDKEPVFEVTGMPENVDRAREEIEMHIALRTGSYVHLSPDTDFHSNGTDVGFEAGALGSPWLPSDPLPPARPTRMISSYRNDSSSSLGSGSTDSYFGSNRLADFSPTSPFGAGSFWFGDALASVDDLEPPAYDSLPAPSQTIWSPLETGNPLPGFGGEAKPHLRGSQPPTPRASPTFPETTDHPLAGRARSEQPSSQHQPGLPIYIPAFSNGTNSYSSSNGGSTSSSPPESRRKHDCVICFESEVVAALVPCGHNLFCMECANKICQQETPSCPVCQTAVTQAIQIHS